MLRTRQRPHTLRQPRQLAFHYLAGRFRGAVGEADADAAARQHQVDVVTVGEEAEPRPDERLLVGDGLVVDLDEGALGEQRPQAVERPVGAATSADRLHAEPSGSNHAPIVARRLARPAASCTVGRLPLRRPPGAGIE